MKMATTNTQITTQPEANNNQSVASARNLQQNEQHQQHLQQQIVPYNNGANNNALRVGQQFLMNTTIDYDTNDNNYNLTKLYSLMFTQVGTVSPTPNSINCQRTQHVFNQQNMMIPKAALLLDNKSTVNYICNPDLVYKIHKVNYCCTVATNVGTTSTCFKASLR